MRALWSLSFPLGLLAFPIPFFHFRVPLRLRVEAPILRLVLTYDAGVHGYGNSIEDFGGVAVARPSRQGRHKAAVVDVDPQVIPAIGEASFLFGRSSRIDVLTNAIEFRKPAVEQVTSANPVLQSEIGGHFSALSN